MDDWQAFACRGFLVNWSPQNFPVGFFISRPDPSAKPATTSFGPWNPGIKSTIPEDLLPLSTLFRTENVLTDLNTVGEYAGFTGLSRQELVFFRPERLVVHELLIRVSADIYVSDGTRYEDLGYNFRDTVSVIHQRYIEPQMDAICAEFYALRDRISAEIESELDRIYPPSQPAATEQQKKGFLSRLFSKKQPVKPAASSLESAETRVLALLEEWRQLSDGEQSTRQRSNARALHKIINAVMVKHGRLVGDRQLVHNLITGLSCNDHGSDVLGLRISSIILEAVEAEQLTLLRTQSEPVVFNIKGASAAGKSTMRPGQKKLAENLGLDWKDFALISPDIWRKYLIDYDELGEHKKYAGMLAGDELPVVDRKMDRYMASKARQGRLSHLLIDRFRFDSFAPGTGKLRGSNLLTRFGHRVFMTFMVTPPADIVERAWLRGEQVGRYKAVDDLLAHCEEAYRGIPHLYFTWALRDDMQVFCEFLDNSVGKDETPGIIACGSDGELNILSLKHMIDIDRYTRVNIDASTADEVFPDAEAMAAANNNQFLKNIGQRIPVINLVDHDSRTVYACIRRGKVAWGDSKRVAEVLSTEEGEAALLALSADFAGDLDFENREGVILEACRYTMGA